MDPILALLETHDFISYQEKGRKELVYSHRRPYARRVEALCVRNLLQESQVKLVRALSAPTCWVEGPRA